jgi:hypothetical protein
MIMWEVIQRTLAKGGSLDDGAALDAALQEDLTFKSVYGGSGDTTGTFTLDATSHTVKERLMGVFEYKSGKVTELATFGIGGVNFKMSS